MSFPDPAAAEEAFYAAFRTLDLEQMKTVWSGSADDSCIHPGGGLLQGADVVLASWAEIFRDSAPPQVRHRLIQTTSDERLAVHTVEESVSTGSGQRHAVILATNIYARGEDGWRMLAHHASLPLVERRAAENGRPALH